MLVVPFLLLLFPEASTPRVSWPRARQRLGQRQLAAFRDLFQYTFAEFFKRTLRHKSTVAVLAMHGRACPRPHAAFFGFFAEEVVPWIDSQSPRALV